MASLDSSGLLSPEIRRTAFEHAIRSRLASENPFIWILGARGSGKTRLLERLADSTSGTLVLLEPITASPEILLERFLAITGESMPKAGKTPAFELFLRILRKKSRSPIFLDELTELKRLSSFPGIDSPLEKCLDALLRSGRPVVATSRFRHWVSAQDASPFRAKRLERLELPPLQPDDLVGVRGPGAEAITKVAGGLAVHAGALAHRTAANGGNWSVAFRDLMGRGALTEAECRACLSELLLRARGYGSCKAVLQVLAEEEGLKLTEISRRMNRTPGSTRDYIKWLEDVDLIRGEDRRFYYTDPVLRLWMRLYGQGSLPSQASFEEEIEAYLRTRLANGSAAPAGIEDPVKQVPAEQEPKPSSSELAIKFPPIHRNEDFLEID